MRIKNVDFEIVRSDRRTLAVEVKTGGEVVVRSPKKLSEKRITEFLISRYDWVLSAIERQKKRADKYNVSQAEVDSLRQMAKNLIPGKVEYWSGIMGLYPTAVKINSARTRFGSCSAKNSLNFSLYLMKYPNEAIDYVVVHELAHIKYKNHQKQFYDLVAKYLPDYRERATLLKNK